MDDIVDRLRARNTEMPHRYPSPPPDGDAIYFRCAACDQMLDIRDRSRCTVDWRAPYLEHQAADEIERLRAEVEDLKRVNMNLRYLIPEEGWMRAWDESLDAPRQQKIARKKKKEQNGD